MTMRKLLLSLALLAVCSASLQAHPSDDIVTKAAQANFLEYLNLLAIPDVADKPADIQRNADFLVASLKRRGFTAQWSQSSPVRAGSQAA